MVEAEPQVERNDGGNSTRWCSKLQQPHCDRQRTPGSVSADDRL